MSTKNNLRVILAFSVEQSPTRLKRLHRELKCTNKKLKKSHRGQNEVDKSTFDITAEVRLKTLEEIFLNSKRRNGRRLQHWLLSQINISSYYKWQQWRQG